MSKVSKEEKLKKAVEDVEARRKRVIAIFDEAAIEAAELTVKAMRSKARTSTAIQAEKLRTDIADKILDRAGFGRRTFELTGPSGSPLVINISESRADKITSAAEL